MQEPAGPRFIELPEPPVPTPLILNYRVKLNKVRNRYITN